WGQIMALAFSPDGALVAAGNGQLIHLWDVKAKAVVRVLHGHTSPLNGLAFTEDGRELISTAVYGDVKRWEVATGKEIGPGLPRDPRPLHGCSPVVSPNGKTVAYMGEGGGGTALWVWEPASGQKPRVLAD